MLHHVNGKEIVSGGDALGDMVAGMQTGPRAVRDTPQGGRWRRG